MESSTGSRIREERLKRGWSQVRLGMLAGIACTDISALERDKRYCPPGWRRRLAAAFKLREIQLFGDVEAAPPRTW